MTDKIPPAFNVETAPPSLKIDWDAYLPFFEDEDIPESAKQELIEALWTIVVSFVDLGFGVHPVQQAREKQIGGQDISLAEMPTSNVVNLDNTTSKYEQTSPSQQDGSCERIPHAPK